MCFAAAQKAAVHVAKAMLALGIEPAAPQCLHTQCRSGESLGGSCASHPCHAPRNQTCALALPALPWKMRTTPRSFRNSTAILPYVCTYTSWSLHKTIVYQWVPSIQPTWFWQVTLEAVLALKACHVHKLTPRLWPLRGVLDYLGKP